MQPGQPQGPPILQGGTSQEDPALGINAALRAFRIAAENSASEKSGAEAKDWALGRAELRSGDRRPRPVAQPGRHSAGARHRPEDDGGRDAEGRGRDPGRDAGPGGACPWPARAQAGERDGSGPDAGQDEGGSAVVKATRLSQPTSSRGSQPEPSLDRDAPGPQLLGRQSGRIRPCCAAAHQGREGQAGRPAGDRPRRVGSSLAATHSGCHQGTSRRGSTHRERPRMRARYGPPSTARLLWVRGFQPRPTRAGLPT
jgi:hypothetical protein